MCERNISYPHRNVTGHYIRSTGYMQTEFQKICEILAKISELTQIDIEKKSRFGLY